MKAEVFKAAVNGDMSILSVNNGDDAIAVSELLGSLTCENNNIIHIAARHGKTDFIREALKMRKKLSAGNIVNQKNNHGDTPLHVAARHGQDDVVRLLALVSPDQKLEQNKDEDIPLHLALKYGHIFLATSLSQSPPYLTITNSSKETPLHLLIRCLPSYSVNGGIQVPAPLLMSMPNSPEGQSRYLLNLFGLGNMLDHFLRLYKDAACLRDIQGFTPLLSAARFGLLWALKVILDHCPESVEVYDFKGRTIVHHAHFSDYRDLEEFFKIPEINALKNVKDSEGNTPGHLAVKNENLLLLKALHEFQADFSLNNDLDISVGELINGSLRGFSQMKDIKERVPHNHMYLKEITVVEKMMDNELHTAALQGDKTIFDKFEEHVKSGMAVRYDYSYYTAQTPNGSNIIHIALRPGDVDQEEFIEEALNRFPDLIHQIDFNGDTPIHLAAKWQTYASIKVLVHVLEYSKKTKVNNCGISLNPWNIKNFIGRMAIHEALYNNQNYAAEFLVENDPEGALYVSDAGETPLHVYARCGNYKASDRLTYLEGLLTKNMSAVCKRDNDGLTPLLRAAKCGRLRVALAMLKQCPQAAQLHDSNGRTFLHLLRLDVEFSELSSSYIFNKLSDQLFSIPEVDSLRIVQDCDGNPPLYYALKTGNTIAAKILARQCFRTGMFELTLVNNESQSFYDIIASYDIPDEIITLFRKNIPRLSTSSFLSSYGIRKAQTKDLAASLSVVAGLLATITFAAAFQVPGGFDGDDGSPVLLRKAAFQVFLVTNAFAMCGSMIVLFSLIWVMTTQDTSDTFKLLDLAFFMLQLSLNTTLVAFMTGVYAATANKTPWLAIFVCTLCSIVILVTRKTSVRFIIKALKYVTIVLFNIKTQSLKELYETGSMIQGDH